MHNKLHVGSTSAHLVATDVLLAARGPLRASNVGLPSLQAWKVKQSLRMVPLTPRAQAVCRLPHAMKHDSKHPSDAECGVEHSRTYGQWSGL